MERSTARRARRRFLQGSLALAGLGLLAGCGISRPFGQQPAKIPVIGFLAVGSRESRAPLIAGFRLGLQDLGYVEGRNIAIEYRFAETNDRLPDRAAELIDLEVDIILASGTPASLAAKRATTTIPIVMGSGGDPVATGLVATLARPGGNVTGMSLIVPQISGKRLELLKAIVPGLSRVAVLLNETNPLHVVEDKEIRAAALVLGVEAQNLSVRTADDFEGAFQAAARAGADAVWGTDDPLITNGRDQLAALALSYRLPSVFHIPEIARAGGLLAVGPELAKVYRHAATHVDKLLKGAKPADIPVEQPTEVDVVINLKTAQALGLTIPPSVLQQATEIIQ
jgi:putative tryptophan/tyrosine transport system substrate-binding protein